jgi:ketosteroid isomerase-like protein
VSDSELAKFIEHYHRAVDAFVTGDTEPQKALWSRQDDVTLANPIGPPARGWNEVEAAMDRAASQLRDGEPCRYDQVSGYATGDLAYILEIQSTRVKGGDAAEVGSVSLRVTTIFRREDGGWRVVHRHADPLTAPRSVESLLQE